MNSAQKIHATTQKFTEIVDFVDNIVILENANACLVIEITASNFALLSQKEQESRVYSYASLLNSLSFPIQILIRNKKVDITSYLNELNEAIKKNEKQEIKNYISQYRDFVNEMVTVNTVLNKSFYLIIPFSSFEMGMPSANHLKQTGGSSKLPEGTTKNLLSKADTVLSQLQKFAVSARILEREDLIKLFYDIYNSGTSIETEQIDTAIKTTIVTGGKSQ